MGRREALSLIAERYRKAARATGRPFLFGALVGSGLILGMAIVLPLTQPRPWQWWQEGPALPRQSGPIVDDADILSADDEQRIETRLRALETKTGHRLAIVTVGSLHDQSIEGFGLRLGRSWGLGMKGAGDDAILIVAPNEQMVRIEVGHGLAKQLSDPECVRIIRDTIIPHFAKEDFAAGIDSGTSAIIRRID